jgi:ribosomal protein S27E
MKAIKVQCEKCSNQQIAWLSKPLTQYKLKCAQCGAKLVKAGA